jgi:hypothetical protein
MGRLTQQLGEKPIGRVIVPWYDDALWAEARDFWEPAGIWRVKRSELAEDITQPHKTVLYVLAHSGRGVSLIASNDGETLSAEQLVRFLVDGGLPSQILAVKIWACFSGVNGFAQEVKAKFLAEQKGYNPVVVGYNEVTGGPKDVANDPHKHVFQLGPDNTRGPVIGRASAHRNIF